MKKVYMVELTKLMVGLMERNISFTFKPCFGGGQVVVADEKWDAICHMGSYGSDEGLLEIMGTIVENDFDTVEGYLTADEVLRRLD